jgi:hypothetical protein
LNAVVIGFHAAPLCIQHAPLQKHGHSTPPKTVEENVGSMKKEKKGGLREVLLFNLSGALGTALFAVVYQGVWLHCNALH